MAIKETGGAFVSGGSMILAQTVETLKAALTDDAGIGRPLIAHERRYIYERAIRDALTALTEAQQREASLRRDFDDVENERRHVCLVLKHPTNSGVPLEEVVKRKLGELEAEVARLTAKQEQLEARLHDAVVDATRLTAENEELRAASSSPREPQKDETRSGCICLFRHWTGWERNPNCKAHSVLREPQKDGTITALRNSGIDVTCGACMEVAYTGVTTNAHTCKLEPHAALIAEIETWMQTESHEAGGTINDAYQLFRRCLLALKGD